MRKQRQSRTAGDNQLHYRHDLTIIKRSTAACADRKSISPPGGSVGDEGGTSGGGQQATAIAI
jgi:uncharacterized membrane protein